MTVDASDRSAQMRQFRTFVIPALAASALLAACGSSSSSKTGTSAAEGGSAATQAASSSGAVVKTATSSTVGGTILVDAHGMTLYSLSAEKNGKFICTSSACLAVWHPLTASAGSTPSGTVTLGTVKRPDGTVQVTYQGMPLYTFAQDTSAGEAKGQGIKDVGTWGVVTVSSASTSTSTTPSSSSGSSGGGEASKGGGSHGY
jgi:predicted lipoprotein with Yx(FWY)xxD motif